MKAPRRVLTAALCALAVSGTLLAASPSTAAATANSAKAASPDAPLFRAKLMVNSSGKCLDVAGALDTEAAFVQQWHCYDAPDNQTWNFVAVGDSDAAGGYFADGYYTIRAQHSGKCLEVAGASQANGARVWQMSCDLTNKNTNQQWRLVQRPNGFFSVVARHSGKCLTVLNGSVADGTGIVQQTCDNDLPYQEWKLI